MPEITAILNTYRRPWALPLQYEAIKSQTLTPKHIMIWQNKGNDKLPLEPLDRNIYLKEDLCANISTSNLGVWARFAYALNATTEYVCIFDDDTIPGPGWFQNCVDTMNTHEGLLGTNGVIFKDLDYMKYDQAGWANPNEEVKEVDIGGQAWFFKRKWLGEFWKEAPIPSHPFSGEDIHFSYALQKAGIKTYVPPHPIANKTIWGSMPETATQLGVDNNAISVNYHMSHFGQNLKDYKEKGFKYINKL